MQQRWFRLYAPLSGFALLGVACWQGDAQPPPGLRPGTPLPGLTREQEGAFREGREEFGAIETPADGVGPVFNGVSCGECHRQGALGGAGDDLQRTSVFRIGGIVNGRYSDLTELGGPVLQRRSLQEFNPSHPVAPEVVPEGAQFVSHRITTPLFGAGLMEAIPDSVILAQTQRRDPDGVAGRPNLLWNPQTNQREIGKFGWKAQVSTLRFFAGSAYLNEMGITTPDFPNELLPQGQPLPAGADVIPEPEDEGEDVELFVNFMRFLAPAPPLPLTVEAKAGQELFKAIRCTSCHTPTLTTGANIVPALNRRPVNLYSDLLLHDMGRELGDGIQQEAAGGNDFRTAPLWGVRFRRFYLHDGRARTLPEAIMAHGGEATPSRERFRRLRERDRRNLLAFLNAL